MNEWNLGECHFTANAAGEAPESPQSGLGLYGLADITISVLSDPSTASLGAGKLQAWTYLTRWNRWLRATEADLTVPGGTPSESFSRQIYSPRGRIAFVPEGIGACKVLIVGGTL